MYTCNGGSFYDPQTSHDPKPNLLHPVPSYRHHILFLHGICFLLPTPHVNLREGSHPKSAKPDLVAKVKCQKQRQRDIGSQKRRSREVAREENLKAICQAQQDNERHGNVGSVRLTPGRIREGGEEVIQLDGLPKALHQANKSAICPTQRWRAKETRTYDVGPKQHDPGNIPTDSRQNQQPRKHRRTPARDAQIRQTRQRRRTQQCNIRHPALRARLENPRRLARQRKTVQRAATSVEETIRPTPRTGQDDSIDDMVETLDARALDPQHEGAGASILSAPADRLQQVRIVGGDSHGDDQGAEDIEDHEAIDEPLARLRDVSSRRLALTCGDGDEFGSQHEGEAGSDQAGPERQESSHVSKTGVGIAFEGTRMLPVAETETVVAGATTEEEDDAEDDEAEDSEDLDGGEPEFGFAVEAYDEDVKGKDGAEDDG